MLIQHLPPESATHTALRDSRTDDELADAAEATADKYGRWSHLELLLAQAIDYLALNQWTLVALKSKKDQAPPQPAPYPRPGVGRPRRVTGLPTGAVRDYFEAMRAEHRRLTGGDDG